MSVERRLARGLGLFSITLGAVQLVAPRRFSRAVGLSRSPSLLIRGVGLREIGAGTVLLAGRRPTGALWGRVAGDAMDLAVLVFSWRPGGHLSTNNDKRGRLTATTAATIGITAVDLASSALATRTQDPVDSAPTTEKADHDGRVRVRKSVTVNRPVEEAYAFWRDLENLPRFMRHLESVERVTDTLSRWRAKGPAGMTFEWNAEIINEVPNQVIGWQSIEGSDVVSAGSVNFDDAGPGRGTRVRVRLQYSAPGGKLGAALARLLGQDPGSEVREDLRQFKQLVESGEVATTEGQPHG
jgi:uncharacterized membrane protein